MLYFIHQNRSYSASASLILASLILWFVWIRFVHEQTGQVEGVDIKFPILLVVNTSLYSCAKPLQMCLYSGNNMSDLWPLFRFALRFLSSFVWPQRIIVCIINFSILSYLLELESSIIVHWFMHYSLVGWLPGRQCSLTWLHVFGLQDWTSWGRNQHRYKENVQTQCRKEDRTEVRDQLPTYLI